MLMLMLLALQDAPSLPEIRMSRSGDAYIVEIAPFPETEIGLVADAVTARAIATCGERGIFWGRLTYTGQLAGKAGGPSRIVEYRRSFNCAVDGQTYPPAPSGWRESKADNADATRVFSTFYAAMDSGSADTAYAMFEPGTGGEAKQFAADAATMRTLLGTGTRRVTSIRWYPNPPGAPHPGVYVRLTFDGNFSKAPVYCGALNLYRAGPGDYRIVGNKEHILPDTDHPDAARIAEYRRNNCN